MSLYEIKGLTFAYPDIISELDDIYLDTCLNDINNTIEQGEFVVVAGCSGSGNIAQTVEARADTERKKRGSNYLCGAGAFSDG